MRTEILNDFAKLGKYETDNGNNVTAFRGSHVFHIKQLESFNACRRDFYNHNANVVDGDIICHQEWFKYDDYLRMSYDRQFETEDFAEAQRIYDEERKRFSIYWDHRFYVVVRSYDGNDYAVNIHPDFYGDFVPSSENLPHEKNGNICQTIIPINELDDNYVFALSDSFIMERLLSTTSEICHESRSLVTPYSLTKLYEINNRELIALRIIAFIDSLVKNGFTNIVISIGGTKDRRDNIDCDIWHTSSDNSKYQFVGHYDAKITGIVLCRPDVARKYEKNGFLLIDYDEMLKGKYVDNMPCKTSNPVRSRTEKH